MSDDDDCRDGDFNAAAEAAEESEDHDLEASSVDEAGSDDGGRPKKKARAAGPTGKAKSKGASPSAAKGGKGGKGAAAPASARAASGAKTAPTVKKGSAAVAPAAPPGHGGGGGVDPPGTLAPLTLKKVNTTAEAEELLLAYLKRGNRPYSALQIFENLHGAVGKTVVPAVLDRLADSGRCEAKLFGKFRLYWASQAQFGETGKDEIAAAQAQAADAQVSAAAAAARRKALTAQVAALGSAMTGPELAAALASTRAAVDGLRSRLARFEGEGAAPLVTPQERAAALAAFSKYRRAWASRRASVMEVVGGMSEAMDKRPRVLCAEIGLETDEDAGVSLKDMPTA